MICYINSRKYKERMLMTSCLTWAHFKREMKFKKLAETLLLSSNSSTDPLHETGKPHFLNTPYISFTEGMKSKDAVVDSLISKFS